MAGRRIGIVPLHRARKGLHIESLEDRRLLSVTMSFQDGVSPYPEYNGTRDARINSEAPAANYGSTGTLRLDGQPDAGVLLKWDVSDIQPGSVVEAVSLTVYVKNPSEDAYEIYGLKRDWGEAQVTWNETSVADPWETPGAQGGGDADSLVVGTVAASPVGRTTGLLNSVGVALVQSWIDDPLTNHGIVIRDYEDAHDRMDLSSREVDTVELRPRLNITLAEDGEGPPQAVYSVRHTPYLQLGDAPLIGFPGSDTDRIEILWQTLRIGDGAPDDFVLEYRVAGSPAWQTAGPIQTIDTLVDMRVVHGVEVDALAYDTDYEYRVRQMRDGSTLQTWQDTFHTRLAAGDDAPFTFVAYGDSAYAPTLPNFRSVQARINQIDPAFAVLLGDNVYPAGTHAEMDLRFDPTINPEAADWGADHIDYLAFGNHDLRTDEGRPTEDSYAVPIPVEGVTAAAAPPPTERPEHNYSFDYGDVHFVTFDTIIWNTEERLDDLLRWIEADLSASDAQWKIVFGHHLMAGGPEKSAGPDNDYYQQMVSRLREAGVDLFLAGHSHTYSRTYPLLGEEDGEATFIRDTDDDYAKGAGLVQVVSGVGGKSIRSGDFSPFPFVAAAFSRDSDPAAEYGFTQIDVTPTQLVVSYIAADDGDVLDRFTLTDLAAGADLGQVAFRELQNLDPSQGELWYRAETTRQGLLTLEAVPATATGDVQLALYGSDPDGAPWAVSTSAQGTPRIDWTTGGAGETYHVRLSGSATDVDLRLANLLQISPDRSQWTVHGTEGDDVFEAVAGSVLTLSVNSVQYESDSARMVQFFGASGADRAVVTGSGGDEFAALGPGGAVLRGSDYEVELAGVEWITLRGGGGNDVAKLFDSPEDDRLVATPVYARLRSTAFTLEVEHFAAVHAYAVAGGNDVAQFFDSPGDDNFYGSPSEAALYGQGFYTRAKHFDAVHAYATGGGMDTAILVGSSGDDVFYGDSLEATLFGNGFYNRAKHFEKTHVHADAGDNDEIILYDAVVDLGFTERPIDGPGAKFARIAWLYDFAKMSLESTSPNFEPVKQAVDSVLTAYWP